MDFVISDIGPDLALYDPFVDAVTSQKLVIFMTHHPCCLTQQVHRMTVVYDLVARHQTEHESKQCIRGVLNCERGFPCAVHFSFGLSLLLGVKCELWSSVCRREIS